jgi:hypothetical protein
VPSLDQLPPYPVESAPTTAVPRPKPRRRRRLVLAGLALLAAAGVALAVAEATVVERRPAGSVGGAALQPSPPNPADTQRQAPRRQAATTTVGPTETDGSTRTETTPSAPAREDVHWTFVWPAVAGADYYNIRFSRAGRTILEAWPRRPRLVVPERGVSRGRVFRFTPGRYRWVVRPGFGPRSRRDYGRAVVLSTWTLAR